MEIFKLYYYIKVIYQTFVLGRKMRNMKAKIISIFVCMLLTATIAIPITANILEKKSSYLTLYMADIYVDDNAPPEWYDATHVKTIQEGINNASTGNTIFVYAGSYSENVIVDKTVNLVGEDKDNTIIHGFDELDHVVSITQDWCNFSEFTVENGGTDSAGIRIESDHCFVHDTIFFDNQYIGLWLDYSEDTTVSDNKFLGNSHGIYIKYSNTNMIFNNNASNNIYYGIVCIKSNENKILDNIVNSNGAIGIYFNQDCDNNDISNNTINSNEQRGIRLYYSDYNMISNNMVYDNSAPDRDGAIVCFYSNNNKIFKNTVDSNNNQGVFLEFSDENMVFNNIISNNDKNGINCTGSKNNVIFHNNFLDNTQNARDDNSNTWYNSTLKHGNYWDDYTGKDNNGDGIGDTPYNIPGGSNKDIYPLMTPYGPPYADFTYIIDKRNVTFNASRSYDYDGVIVLYEWDFGDDTYGTGSPIIHTYSNDGTYDVTLTVTDNDGKIDSAIKTIIVDSTPPEIIDNTPSVAYTGDSFTFNATITDNVEVGGAVAAFHYKAGGDDYNQDLYNTYGDYWEGTIIIKDTLDIIVYSIMAWDTANNLNCSELKNITIYDNDNPEITNIKADPWIQMINGYVNLSAVVTDNIDVSEVYLYILYPDSSVKNFSIKQNKVDDTYYYNQKYTQEGSYTFHIWANDNSGNANISEDKIFKIVLGSPPEKPQITGQTNGTVGDTYTYTFSSTDPDGDNVYYYIDWGDGTNTSWFGPFASGVPQQKDHSWSKKGTYTIMIIARDTKGLESPWGTLKVTMPKGLQSDQQSSTNSNTQTIKTLKTTTKTY
jgi:parallel beta-helix repeat protein